MNSSASDPNLVGQVVAEWRERLRRGERFELDEYTARYPTIADELRDLFPALVMIEDLKGEVGDLTGSVAAGSVQPGSQVLERLGDYRILREIGRGGMGIVYEAEQESLGRRVALKVLPGGAMLDEHQQKRFQREAKAAARMHHTNIVPVYGVGEHEGMLYYVMQFIQGLGLDEVLTELRRLHEARGGSPPTTPARTKDVSAVDVAQSLLTGQFAAAGPATLTKAPDGAGSSNGQASGELPAIEVAPGGPAPATCPDARELAKGMGVPPVNRGQESGVRSQESAGGPSTLTPAKATRTSPTEKSLSESGRHYWLSVARIGVQVAEALDYAHSQGVLHRDIKPSNLLLDTQGTVWVTDFGLAKAATDSDALTHTGDIVGTLRYMAPERFNGVSDAKGDIYSLGLTLYELVCQRPAYEETDRNQLVKRVMDGAPAQPRKLNAAIPRDLETIIVKAIDHEPTRRYASARALADDLKRFLDDKPIQARQAGAPERLWRWCRRNPVIASLSAALLVLLVALAAGSTVVALRFQSMAKEENRLRVKESQLRESADDARSRADGARATAEANLQEAQRQKKLAEDHLQEAERQKKLAETNFRQARRAIDDSLTRISESKLLNVPGLQPLRKELLEAALRYYQGFLQQHADNPAVQKDLATAYTLVAKITADVASREKALQAYGQALALRKQLLQRNPNDLDLQADLALHHQAIGRLQQTDNPNAALQSLQEAAGILRTVIPRSQNKLELLHAFASVHNDLGVVYVRKNEPLEAMSYYTAALKLQRQLVHENRDHPRSPQLKYDLANQLTRMGKLQGDIGLSTEALKLHGEALALLRAIVAAPASGASHGPGNSDRGHDWPRSPEINDWQRALAASHEAIGDVQDQEGQPAEALKSYLQALPVRLRLATANPAVTDYQGDLAHAHFTLGQLQAKRNQTAAAALSYRSAIDRQRLVVAAVPESPEPVRLLARQFARLGAAQRQLGQPAEALHSYREARALLETLPQPAPGDLYELGCSRAACGLLVGHGKTELTQKEQAQRQKDAELALDALRKAVASGFRDLARLRNDPELEALRPQASFKELLVELEKKVKVLAWEPDFEAAKARAAREKKDLFIYFTGSDWCYWCLLVRREVFGKDAFLDAAPRHFVLVELDFPRYKVNPKNFEQNRELFHRWGLKGFPSLILADAQGRPYANLRGGTPVRDTPEAYVQLMTKLRQNRLARDEHFTRALAEEGQAKANSLDRALSLLPRDFIQADYGDALAQVLELDPLDKAGLRSKYLPLLLGNRRIDVQDAMKKQDWDGTIVKIDKIINDLKPTDTVAADMLLNRARAYAKLSQWDKAEADYTRAVELKPADANLRIERGRFFEKRGQPEKAAADFRVTIDTKKKLVETSRAAFTRTPHVLKNRVALSDAYRELGEVQRKAGRPADAAATALLRVQLWPGHFSELYDAACELALCVPAVGETGALTPQQQAERRRYADQAMDLLRRSVLAGMTDVAHFKADTDLTALHGRDDYKALVRQLEQSRQFSAATDEGRVLKGHTHPLIESVAFAPDSRRVLSSGFDNTVRLWDAETGKELHRLTGHTGLVHGLAFSADGRRIVTSGSDGTVRLWDAQTGKEIKRFTGHSGNVYGVAMLPDGKQILSCGKDKTLRLWDVETGKEIRQLTGHSASVAALALTADGRRAVSVSGDATLRFWEVATGKELQRLKMPQAVWSVAVSWDGRRALAGSTSGPVFLWDLDKGRLLRRQEDHWAGVRAVGFTPDGKRALSASVRGGLVLGDVETGAEIYRFAPTLPCGGLAVAPDGRRVATANNDGKVHLWALAEGTLRARTHAQLGELDKALAGYDQVVTQRPGDTEVRIERARFHAHQRQWDKAIADFAQVLQTRPDDVDALVERGRCHARLGRWDDVAADFGKAFALLPDDAAGQRRAWSEELAAWDKSFAKVLAARPKDAQLLFARGRWHARHSRWQEGAVDFAKGMELGPPDNAETWFEHASLRLLAGDGEGYRRVCASLLAAHEKKGSAVMRPFLVARACTLAPAAVPDLKKPAQAAQQELTTNAAAYWSLTQQGALFCRAGRSEEAQGVLKECMEKYPDWDGQILNRLWRVLVQYQQGQKEDARESLTAVGPWFDKHGGVMPSKREGTLALHLHDWLEAHILHREAQALVKGVAGTSP
ncbi:MAG: protein kinase [Planctomycetes bacterium]|nr:protein kinase [Planctomycetota bacterium]